MKVSRVSYKTLAATFTLGLMIPMAPLAAGEEPESTPNAAQEAFDYWAPRLMTSNPTFTVDGVTPSTAIGWVLAVTDNADLISAAADASEEFLRGMQDPVNVSELTGGVDEITPAITDDGHLVAVLPAGKAETTTGKVSLEDVEAGVMLQVTDDEESLVPIAAPDSSIQLLYDVVTGGKHVTSGFDLIDAASPAVTVTDLEVSYANGKEDSPDFEPITNLTITPINPDTENVLREVVRVLNDGATAVTSILEVLRTPADGEVGDPAKGGLLSVLGLDGNPLLEKILVQPGKETVEHTIEFVSPAEGEQVYLVHRVVDAEGVDIVQPDMRTLPSMKPTMDVQASSQEGSRKLAGHGKQTIYNQAKLRQLTPGKPYQVLVNLSQCSPSGGCVEVAAVNREIIPRDTTERTENFAVDIDTTNVPDDNTFEWTTTLWEGTGDIYNMGPQLAGVADHPSSQVLSFSGDGTTLNKPGQDTVQQHSDTELEIRDEAPPASMEEVRANNDKLDARAAESGSWKVWAIGGGVAAAIAAVVGVMLVRSRRRATGEV